MVGRPTKIARVVSQFKNGNVNKFTNDRHISLLSQFSKTLEKIFHKRMLSFIEEKNIIFGSQYGFRENMSTSLAILELVENITISTDDCKSTVGKFIDLKRLLILEIDSVDHCRLFIIIGRGVMYGYCYSFLCCQI